MKEGRLCLWMRTASVQDESNNRCEQHQNERANDKHQQLVEKSSQLQALEWLPQLVEAKGDDVRHSLKHGRYCLRVLNLVDDLDLGADLIE